MSQSARILVVDDNEGMRVSLQKILQKEGHRVLLAENGASALEVLREQEVDLLLTDLRMPGMDGLELTRQARQFRPALVVILVTAFGSIETAVGAMREGAHDFVTKPLERSVLVTKVDKALETRELVSENERLRERLRNLEGRRKLIGRSLAMQQLFELIEQVAPSRATVLIEGESGTGKELVAQALHELSPRHKAPFIKVACAALPETLLEAELFGHEKGAFTGAFQRREGRFKLADGGTLLLDEIGEMPIPMQLKLLRVLQEGEFERIGGTQTLGVDVRLLSATNRDLSEEVRTGRFREDLYYRLNVITLHIPPLRERPEDVPILAEHFLRLYSERNDKNVGELSRSALDLLQSYPWPGNVRELENAIERAVVLARGKTIRPEDLPPGLHRRKVPAPPSNEGVTFPIGTPLQEVERGMLEETLRHTGGNKEAAASLLGISSRTIYRKLARTS